MKSYRIAIIPGDGIGPEVMDAALEVIQAACDLEPDVNVTFTSHEAGAEHYRETGVTLPDAVLLSAIGLPDVRKPDGTEVQPEMMVGLRRGMKLHSAVRPVKLYPGVPCPLKDTSKGIDFVVIRENLEGMFASFGGGSIVGMRLLPTRSLLHVKEHPKYVISLSVWPHVEKVVLQMANAV